MNDSLQHCGSIRSCVPLLIHNDLKTDNVVLEKRGRSVAFSTTKNSVPKFVHLKWLYKDSYVALELVDGTGKPSAKSDKLSSISCPKSTGNFVHEHRRGKKDFEKFARRATGH